MRRAVFFRLLALLALSACSAGGMGGGSDSGIGPSGLPLNGALILRRNRPAGIARTRCTSRRPGGDLCSAIIGEHAIFPPITSPTYRAAVCLVNSPTNRRKRNASARVPAASISGHRIPPSPPRTAVEPKVAIAAWRVFRRSAAFWRSAMRDLLFR